MNDEQLNKLTKDYLTRCYNASRDANDGIIIGAQMLERENAIVKAIRGTLNEANTNKVIRWIVQHFPKTTNMDRAARVMETAWQVFTIGIMREQKYSSFIESKEFDTQEMHFANDVRSEYLNQMLRRNAEHGDR